MELMAKFWEMKFFSQTFADFIACNPKGKIFDKKVESCKELHETPSKLNILRSIFWPASKVPLRDSTYFGILSAGHVLGAFPGNFDFVKRAPNSKLRNFTILRRIRHGIAPPLAGPFRRFYQKRPQFQHSQFLNFAEVFDLCSILF